MEKVVSVASVCPLKHLALQDQSFHPFPLCLFKRVSLDFLHIMSLGCTKYWQSFIISSKSLLRALVFILIQLIIINLLWYIQMNVIANFKDIFAHKTLQFIITLSPLMAQKIYRARATLNPCYQVLDGQDGITTQASIQIHTVENLLTDKE